MRRQPIDSRRLNRTRLDGERRVLAHELGKTRAQLGRTGVRAFLERELTDLAPNLEPEAQIRRFQVVLALLDEHADGGQLDHAEIERLGELGRGILTVLGIQPETSKLAFTYGALHLALARARARDGRSFAAAWETQLALFASKGSEGASSTEQAEEAYQTAAMALRRGDATLAMEGFAVAEALGEGERARLGKFRALRLAGRLEEAAAAGLTIGEDLAWESASLAAAGGDLAGVIKLGGRGGARRDAESQLLTILWAMAASEKQWLARVMKTDSIRRGEDKEAVKRGGASALLAEITAALEVCHDPDVPLRIRLEGLGEALERCPRLNSVDAELLAWAAASRWLVRHHQYLMAAVTLGEYRTLSLKLSDGHVPDVLGLTADLSLKAWFRFEEAGQRAAVAIQVATAGIRTSRLLRAADLAVLGVSISGAMMKGRIKRFVAGDDKAAHLRAVEDQEIARHVAKTIGRLKGPFTKVAQVLGFLAPRLPDEIQQALAATRDATQPITFAAFRKAVEEGLRRPLTDLFARIDEKPLSAASIGQLHRATMHDGREVVVKCQYPGIREAIEADMALIRWLGPVAKRIFPGANVDEVMEAARLHMLAECDYRREAELQTYARMLAERHPGVLVPAVMPTHTSETVLTMEYVDGATFDVFTARATQEERDKAGQTIYAYVWDSLLNEGFFNGDPHPGNYLFLRDGRVALLDYGYAEHFPEARRLGWRRVIQALLEGDKETFIAAMPTIGYFAPGAPIDGEAMWRAARSMATAIITDEPMRFQRSTVAKNIERATLDNENRPSLRIPVEDVRAMRFVWCLQATLGVLGAEGVWSRIIRSLFAEQRPRLSSGA